MRILKVFRAPEEGCPYLAEERWQLEYLRLASLTPAEYDLCLEQGWFKYGHHLQRPVCRECTRCESMRVSTEAFTPSRAQRRALARNAHLTVRFESPPPCDGDRLSLHNRYRWNQFVERGWPPMEWDADGYEFEFGQSPLPMTEISVWDGANLCAVVLADVGANCVAGVTHYYDLDLRGDSIGLFAMLQTFELARRLAKPWVYLGYYVPNSPTMGYKIQFRPGELRGNDGVWRPA